MRKRLLRKCIIGLLLLVMLATLTLVGSTSITQAQPPQGTVQIIVKFKSSNNSTAFAAAVQGSDNITPVAPAIRGSDNIASIASAVQASGGRGLRDLPQLRTHVISVPAGAAENVLAALANDPSVERATKAIKFHQAGTPDDPEYIQQWALPKIAWDQVYGATPITGSAIIAVLDTGVDAGHPDLAGRMGSGQSFVNGDANSDSNGHGTALAGIAAADVNNAMGIAGVAYAGVTVSSVQVLQPDGTGLDSDVIAGVVWAVDNGAKVILMGFSSADYSAALEDALQYAWSQGVVLVAATGNDSSSAPSYPAGMENVLGVAATDQDDNLASYSNTGSACVAAPGLDIYTTMSGGNYGAINGTSAAAAETAGLAALLVASGQSNDYIYNQVRGAVDPITDQPFGRINVATAMGEAATPPPGPVPEPPPPPGPTPPVYEPAAMITTAGSGNWNSTVLNAPWPGGTVPAVDDDVTIRAGDSVTVTADATIYSITFGNTSTNTANLTVNSGMVLTVTAGITSQNSATISTAATIAGAGTIACASVTVGGTTAPTGGNRTTTLTSTVSTFTITNNLAITSVRVNANVRNNATFALSSGSVSVGGSVAFTTSNNANSVATLTMTGAPANGTLTLSGATPFTITGTGTATFSPNGAGATVVYSGAAQTVRAVAYRNLTLSGSGTKTLTGVNTVNGNLTLSGTATATTAAALTISGNLDVGNDTTLTVAGFNITVTGTTLVTGTLTHSSTTGTKSFRGLVTIDSGGVWDNSINEAINFRGGLTHNGTTFNAGTGIYTFTNNAQAIGGTSPISIPNVTVNVVNLTNNGTLTVGTDLAGSGTLINDANATLNIGGTSGITGLTATANPNTVNYNGAAQTVKAVTYHHLTLSGSGAKTLTGVTTINGNLTLSGTATATTAANLTIGGNLDVGNGTTFTVGANFTLGVAGTTSVTGTYTDNSTGAKTLTGDVTLNSGGVWNETAVSAYSIAGNFTNNATTFTASTGTHTFSGATKILSGSTATSIPNVAVTGTYTNNGTLTVGTALTGTGGLTQGTNAMLNIGGTSTIATLTATAIGNTVNYNGSGAQTIPALNYYNLTISAARGANNITLASGTIGVAGTFSPTATFSGGTYVITGSTVDFTGAGSQNIPAFNYNNLSNSGSGARVLASSGTVGIAGTFTPGTNSYTITGSTIDFNGTGAQTVPAFNYNNLTSSSSGARTLASSGTIGIAGTFTPGTNSYTITSSTIDFNGTGAQTVPAFNYNNLTSSSSGARTLASSGTIGIAGTFTPGTNSYTITGSTIDFNGTGAQTVPAFNFNNLTISNASGVNLGGSVAITNGLTLTSGTFSVGANTLTLNGPTIAGTPANLSTTSSSSLVFGGSSTGVNIPNSVIALNNLTINNANGVMLNSSPTISGTLTLTSGNITTGANTLIIASTGSVSGGSDSSYIIGNLQKTVSSSAASPTFEVGLFSGYNPVNLAFTGVPGTGTVTVHANSGDLTSGTPPINAAKSVNVYWTLVGTVFTFTDYSATFNFNNPDDIDIGAITANFIVGEYSSSTWTTPTVGTQTTTSTQATGITTFGDFAVGEPNEFISFTIEAYGGIDFGSRDPGMIDWPAIGQNSSRGAVTLTVSSNVDVDVKILGVNFTGPGTPIDIGNVKYNSDNTTSGAFIMTDTYVRWYTVPANTDNTTECYLWITIPPGQAPGGPYNGTFYYQAKKSGE